MFARRQGSDRVSLNVNSVKVGVSLPMILARSVN